ncbi:MAG: hypothetical protein OI860_00230 (plasmid) [Candidatus Methanoperedens sp.]|uniref:hypothetical protein n=1 Tax=Candidatus Methanoperedens sp. BLZ2 TaxID=2035255 RepID=UPI000BE3BAA2|nr:hypothetical protein [Candidatus Methanoperedens sp. BLZ2]KAB2946439.1 MAG: hypothetical protein F9K14_07590 [Candidatus Methanoperedens sp.]MBZ0175675.1 hypothetical protein [Candidatus Methanoperedens nitroreducens]WAH95055.1 MAG: hypothetical protein OI863_00235 [Candidatus Methanoperedens sp.]WAM22223.1 MAG: hypothetical protein OI860_00230 [Candidatus Methanoperedens sp.]
MTKSNRKSGCISRGADISGNGELGEKNYIITKNEFNLGVIVFIFTAIFSIFSLIISNEALSHQNIIEEANLQIGSPQYSNSYINDTYLNKSSIRIPLVNGYYARYPTLIDSIQGVLNGKKMDLKEVPIIETKTTHNPKSFWFVDRDKPTYIEIVFTKYPYYNLTEDESLYTIKLVPSNDNLNDGKNFMILEIHYTDFSKMVTWTINPNIEFTVSDGKINSVSLVKIEKREINKIN